MNAPPKSTAIIPIRASVSSKIKFELTEGRYIEFTFPYAVSDDNMTLSWITEFSVLIGTIGNKLVPVPPAPCPNGQYIFWFTPNTNKKGTATITIPWATSVSQWFFDSDNGWHWHQLDPDPDPIKNPKTWQVPSPFYCMFCVT